MIEELLEESKSNLDHFFSTVNISHFTKIIDICANCKGFVICMGIGKSGIIAEKIASTLASTGTKALYLATSNFLHGDIGIVSENDIVLMFSKSGSSEELITLIPFIRRKKARVIGITSHEASCLAKEADCHLCLPVCKELCAFDLVPTTSTQVQLVFGDILATSLMRKRAFTLDDYALNHPIGAIGRKLTLTVNDLMVQGENIPFCYPEDSLRDVLFELTQKRCGALVVVDQKQHLQGIFTDGDLRRSLQKYGSEVLYQSMQHLMTQSVTSVESQTLAWDAMKKMQQNIHKWVMVTPVLENKVVIGLLRMHDIIRAGLS